MIHHGACVDDRTGVCCCGWFCHAICRAHPTSKKKKTKLCSQRCEPKYIAATRSRSRPQPKPESPLSRSIQASRRYISQKGRFLPSFCSLSSRIEWGQRLSSFPPTFIHSSIASSQGDPLTPRTQSFPCTSTLQGTPRAGGIQAFFSNFLCGNDPCRHRVPRNAPGGSNSASHRVKMGKMPPKTGEFNPGMMSSAHDAGTSRNRASQTIGRADCSWSSDRQSDMRR